jgi:lipopolysaccharide transport system ATP-binding protein
MNEVIIVENLGKKYIISHQGSANDTFREMITKNAKRIFKNKLFKNSIKEEFWALKNISFKINQGERIGIIGRNGAGKSTLLKLLSRITEPTEGRIRIRGKVASLLEVGTGFHPELTGRENIYLNGAVLGMARTEIKKKFDDIVTFSGVENFLDTPVKRYSSGMYVRLAFAVAAHLDPDILLIDEVLAVGDVEFQKKCIGQMEEVSKKEGRTIIFVSHNLGAVSKLCNRSIWIDKGLIKEEGFSENVISSYLSDNNSSNGVKDWSNLPSAPGDHQYLIMHYLKILNIEGQLINTINAEDSFFIEIEYEILKKLVNGSIGFLLSRVTGEVIFSAFDNNLALNKKYIREPGIYKSKWLIPGYFLNQGMHSISLIGHIPGLKFLVNEEHVLTLTITQKENIGGQGIQPGLVRPLLKFDVEKIG